jgi:hypothetical protein
MDYYERFSDDLKLRGYAKRSRQSYLRAVRQFQHYCCKTLPEITEDDAACPAARVHDFVRRNLSSHFPTIRMLM